MYAFPPAVQCSPGGDFGPFVINGEIILPWQMLKELYGVEWFAIQGALQNVPGGYDSLGNMIEARKWVDILIAFYWNHPWADPRAEADLYDAAVQLEMSDEIWIDVEEVVKSATSAGVEYYTDYQITSVCMAIYERMQKQYPEIETTLYTRPEVIEVYAPSLISLCRSLRLIAIAAWPDYGMPNWPYYKTLDEIRRGDMKEYDPRTRTTSDINVHDGAHGPNVDLFPNADVIYWQKSSRMRPANSGIRGNWKFDHGYDWDAVNLTHAQHLARLGVSPRVPAAETPPPAVVTPGGVDLTSLYADVDELKSLAKKIKAAFGG